jgi:hypothetical protein
MYLLLYLLKAFNLLRYCLSPSYRIEAHARWKKSKSHLVVSEIGGGIIGLVVFVALVLLIVKLISE